jgi:hypothetical protein
LEPSLSRQQTAIGVMHVGGQLVALDVQLTQLRLLQRQLLLQRIQLTLHNRYLLSQHSSLGNLVTQLSLQHCYVSVQTDDRIGSRSLLTLQTRQLPLGSS